MGQHSGIPPPVPPPLQPSHLGQSSAIGVQPASCGSAAWPAPSPCQAGLLSPVGSLGGSMGAIGADAALGSSLGSPLIGAPLLNAPMPNQWPCSWTPPAWTGGLP